MSTDTSANRAKTNGTDKPLSIGEVVALPPSLSCFFVVRALNRIAENGQCFISNGKLFQHQNAQRQMSTNLSSCSVRPFNLFCLFFGKMPSALTSS